MDEHLLVTMVSEVGYKKSPSHYLQVVRHSDWTIVWRPAAGTEGFVYTYCDRCSSGLVVRPGGLLPDRVTHSCPCLEGPEDEARLLDGGGPASGDGCIAYWEVAEGRDEGGEEASEGSELRLPVRDVREEVPGLRLRELWRRCFPPRG